MSIPSTQARRSERGSHDQELIYSILDEALFCHVGFVDDGHPVVIPMLHARIGDEVFLHGSPATRLFRRLSSGPDVCVTVTLLDGLVLARSAFEHSANYRSVVIFGRPKRVPGIAERREALDAFTDKLVPGRRPHLRAMTDKEVRGTTVLRLPIDHASAKMRSGPPVDEEADYQLPIWAGVIPLRLEPGKPVPDPRNLPEVAPPEHVRDWGGSR
jgi:hypothetical protein